MMCRRNFSYVGTSSFLPTKICTCVKGCVLRGHIIVFADKNIYVDKKVVWFKE
ncbi:hypothetical protein IC582_004700 [Cucumis melo]